jgi:hypothetical protein
MAALPRIRDRTTAVLNFSTTAAGQLARRYTGTKRSVQRRRVRLDGRFRFSKDIKRRFRIYASALGEAAYEPAIKVRLIELCELEVLAARLRPMRSTRKWKARWLRSYSSLGA